MKPIAGRISKFLQSFLDHVKEKNKDGLIPKLISNAQLTAKCLESCRNEISQQAEFLKFHETIAAGEHVIASECH